MDDLLKGKFWFSAQQLEIYRSNNSLLLPGQRPHRGAFCRLNDGTMHQYTELKSGKWRDEPSGFDDAIYLGEGDSSHLGDVLR